MQSRPLRIGTRGSPLALWQANAVRERLLAAHGLEPEGIAVEVIRTSGDRLQGKPLRDFGGKGLFTKEIEEALIAGAIDFAVHSMKDMPTLLPGGLAIGAHLEREDPRDAFIGASVKRLADLPEGATLGTASLRREAQLRRMRPDLAVVPMRGNVETRLKKLAGGAADATLLAQAGLKRLGLEGHAGEVLSPDIMLPAVAQGVIGVEIRESDDRARALLAPLDHGPTAMCATAERSFLAALDGSCRTPIAALAEPEGDGLRLRGMILRPGGGEAHETAREGSAADAAAMGADAGAELLARAGPGFFKEL